MSKEGSSGEASSPEVQADVSPKDTNAEIYENRGPKKIIRVVTVIAYLFSVSFVGILLSAYYIFLWDPPNPRLINRGRLQADPQMQSLIATVPSEKTDLRKKGNDFFLENEVNRADVSLLNRMPYSAYDGDDPNVNSQDKKQERLNVMLLKLRHSLMETHARNRNLSKHETVISGGPNNSSIRGTMLNSISNKLRKNISEEKTRSNTDLPEFMDPINMLDIENTAKTVHENKTKHKYLNGRFINDANPIVDREEENRNYRNEHSDAKLYSDSKSSDTKANDDIINDSNHRGIKRNNSFKEDQEFLKINIVGDMKELIKPDEIDNRQLINGNRKNDSNNVHTIITSKDYKKDLTKRLLSINVNVNNLNFRQNYSSDNHIKEINEVSTVPSSHDHDSRYIHNSPGSHQPSDDPTVVKSQAYTTRNSEETQIERMTVKSTTMNNKELKEIDISSTQPQKSLLEILTEITNIEETSNELTSISTVQDYRNNFTSTINVDNDDNVT
ncbi:homeobox protein 3 [Nylanderia fulva]|uniref:homeobox protein 3 n=1 Tax=Nylanderia fulva TaxID=613905 RepID=UPI0010FB73F1|nr:homeobox protein 3 [Nylanderia fulva]